MRACVARGAQVPQQCKLAAALFVADAVGSVALNDDDDSTNSYENSRLDWRSCKIEQQHLELTGSTVFRTVEVPADKDGPTQQTGRKASTKRRVPPLMVKKTVLDRKASTVEFMRRAQRGWALILEDSLAGGSDMRASYDRLIDAFRSRADLFRGHIGNDGISKVDTDPILNGNLTPEAYAEIEISLVDK